MSLPDCDGWGSFSRTSETTLARTHRLVILLHVILSLTQSDKLLVGIPEDDLDNTRRESEDGDDAGHSGSKE